MNQAKHRRLPSTSQRLLRAIAEAQEFYDRRYRELVGPDEHEAWRDEDDTAASWTTVVLGPRLPPRSRN